MENYMLATSVLGSSSSSEDEEEYESPRRPRRTPVFRNRTEHFVEWDEIDFHIRFRLSKRMVNCLLDLIRHKIQHPTNRNKALQPDTMLLLTIRYLATGCMLVTVGDFCGIHKSSASKHIWKVLKAIGDLRPQYVCLKNDSDTIYQLQSSFCNIARFPKVIGAIDCTHVRIVSPGGDHAETFRNRKGFFSINVQAVCAPNLEILNVVARWPGSVHDARIFENSALKHDLESGLYPGCILLGDSGYALRPYCITPILNIRNAAENLFNESQIRTRNPIERCFGVLKKRFPVLSLGIRLNLEKVQGVVVACTVLHNMAVRNREVDPPLVTPEIQQAIDFVNAASSEGQTHSEIINNHRLPYVSYFENLQRS